MSVDWLTERVLAALIVEPPPAPSHPNRGRGRSLNKLLNQCHFCGKKNGQGVTLRKCGACEGELYCGRECQKAAWKNHKRKCLLNRRVLSMDEDRVVPLKALRAFTDKHKASIMTAASYALNLLVDPSAGQRDLVLIVLTPRADSTRAATSFFATDISVVPIDSHPWSEELRAQLQLVLANEEQKRAGTAHTAMLVILLDTASLILDVLPLVFQLGTRAQPQRPADWQWDTWLKGRLNYV